MRKTKLTSENTERAIKHGQTRETGNIRYTRQRKAKQSRTQYVVHTTICKQTQIT